MGFLRRHYLLVSVINLAIGICAFIYIVNNNTNESYRYMWILPLGFALLSPLLFRGLIRIPFAPFVWVFYGICLVRYVVLPFMNTWHNYYLFRSPLPPSASSLFTAEMIMTYELIVVCMYLNLRHIDIYEDVIVTYNSSQEIPQNQIYHIFIIFAIAIYVAIPAVRNNINVFFAKETSTDISPFILLLILMVILAKNLFFILCVQKLYEKKVSGILLYLCLLLLLVFNCSVYYGTNRSDFLLSVIACVYITSKLYPKQIKIVGIGLLVFLIIIFASISASRNFYRVSKSSSIVFIDMCQGYCGSLYNVGIAVEAAIADIGHRNIIGLINDFLRPSLGTNMIMKLFNIPLSNEIFNARMYMQSNRVVQIMPMIGEGYFYFGPLFCPLLDLVFLEIAVRLIKLLNRGDFESKFFLTITCTRLGFLMGQNSQIQMNDLSFNLFLFYIIWWLNKHTYIRKR